MGSTQLQPPAFWVTSLPKGEHKPQPRCIFLVVVVVGGGPHTQDCRARMLTTHCWLVFTPHPRDFGATEAPQHPASSLIPLKKHPLLKQSKKSSQHRTISHAHPSASTCLLKSKIQMKSPFCFCSQGACRLDLNELGSSDRPLINSVLLVM